MPRKSSRNTTAIPLYSEVSRTDEAIKSTRSRPPPKDRRSVAEEQVAAKEAPEAGMGKVVSPQRRKKREVTTKTNPTKPTETMAVRKSPRKSGVTKELESSLETVSREASPVESKKPGAKRKVEIGEVHETEDKKVKKRKTKGDKENESSPPATRTSIQTLKRAMYIGAHVSSAGGKYHM
jgi:hypothetical protein